MKGLFMKNLKELYAQYLEPHKDWLFIIGLSLLGLLLIYQGIEKQKRKMGLDSAVIEVLVAKRSILDGESFSIEDLRKEIIPQKYVPMGALYPEDVMRYEGQRINRSIAEGEILLTNALDIDFSLDNPSSKIQSGYRALSIPVDELSSVSGSIQAGDHIDLLTTIEMGNQQKTTMTLLQNVTVLAAGGSLRTHNSLDEGYSSLVLMVLPEEAPLIMHAVQNYELSIILRNPYDQDTLKDLPMITKNDIKEAGFLHHLQSQRDQRIRIIRGQASEDW